MKRYRLIFEREYHTNDSGNTTFICDWKTEESEQGEWVRYADVKDAVEYYEKLVCAVKQIMTETDQCKNIKGGYKLGL